MGGVVLSFHYAGIIKFLVRGILSVAAVNPVCLSLYKVSNSFISSWRTFELDSKDMLSNLIDPCSKLISKCLPTNGKKIFHYSNTSNDDIGCQAISSYVLPYIALSYLMMSSDVTDLFPVFIPLLTELSNSRVFRLPN